MAARIKDIAADLGVSLMTVSKALRNHSDISEKTRKRVMRRARELGYQPNWIARSLVTRRTYMVGLVIPDLMHSFFAEVAKGAARKFDQLGYQIVIADTEENAEAENRQVATLLARNVDGLIIASAQRNGRARLFTTLRRQKVPHVLVDRLPAGAKAHYVGCKDELIGEMATNHLIEQGCRRIAHIRGPEVATGTGRLCGYRSALAAAGMEAPPSYVVGGRSDDEAGYAGMQQLLRLEPRPDGVFCYNDPVAAGAIRAALEWNLSVPRDIAVIGSGNVHYSDLLRVPLSTIDQNSCMIGETAATLLIECIEAKKPLRPRTMLIEPKLVVRASSSRGQTVRSAAS